MTPSPLVVSVARQVAPLHQPTHLLLAELALVLLAQLLEPARTRATTKRGTRARPATESRSSTCPSASSMRRTVGRSSWSAPSPACAAAPPAAPPPSENNGAMGYEPRAPPSCRRAGRRRTLSRSSVLTRSLARSRSLMTIASSASLAETASSGRPAPPALHRPRRQPCSHSVFRCADAGRTETHAVRQHRGLARVVVGLQRRHLVLVPA